MDANSLMRVQCVFLHSLPGTRKLNPEGGFDDVYRIFLVDTPIGPYFEEYLKEADVRVWGFGF